MRVVTAASVATLNSRARPRVGDDVTVTSLHLQQVPVVYSRETRQRPEMTSLAGSGAARRAQSSSAVHQYSDAAGGQSARRGGQAGHSVSARHSDESPALNDRSVVATAGIQRLGSTYDEGDYDPLESAQAAVMTTPLITSSLAGQHQQTSAFTSSSSYTPPHHQQQQLTTGSARGHQRTQSSGGRGDWDRSWPASSGSVNRVTVQTDHRRQYVDDGLDSWDLRRPGGIQQPSTAGRQASSSSKVMVVSNVGYEPTTLQHTTAQRNTVQASHDVVHSQPDSWSTSLKSDTAERGQSSRSQYDRSASSTAVHQRVQTPSYATVHRTTPSAGGSSLQAQRAVVVDSSQLASPPQQQQETSMKQRVMTGQEHREAQQRQQPAGDHHQHQLLIQQRQHAVAQNLAISPSRTAGTMQSNTPGTVTQTGGGGSDARTTMTSSADDSTVVKRADVSSGGSGGVVGGRAEVIGPVMRRAGGADTPTGSISSTASWRSATASSATPQQRLSNASSSGATEHSSVEIVNESTLERSGHFIGERPVPVL